MALEKPEYEVLSSDGDFELRRYEPYIVAETLVDGEFDRAGNEGFRRLADYIFGNNRRRQSIEMTAPVTQETSQKIAMTAPVAMDRADDQWRITFMMPSEYTLETVPEPVDERVVLKEVPAETFAVVVYSGTWSQKRYLEHEGRLLEWVRSRGLEAIGEPVFARYDPPFKPWFLRRNEVLIRIEER